MLQSVIVYGFIIFSMMFLGKISEKRMYYFNSNEKIMPFFTIEVLLAMLIFIFFSGVRYHVGVDYEAYAENFQLLSNNRNEIHEMEPLFIAITKLVAKSGLGVIFYFGILSFVQLYFVYKAFENERFIYQFLIFTLICSGTYFMWMNGIRQMIVACMFVYSIRYIKQKKLIPYFVFILIGFFIHKSSLLLIPFYFILNKDIFKSIFIQLLFLFIAVVFSYIDLWSYFINIIEKGVMILNYDNYEQAEYQLLTRQNEFNRGIRFYFPILMALVIILFNKKMKNSFSDFNIVPYYNIFFIGLIIWILFFNNPLLQRPFLYFINSDYIIKAFFMVFLWRNLKTKSYLQFVLILFVILQLGMLYAYIISDFFTQYHFIWEYC